MSNYEGFVLNCQLKYEKRLVPAGSPVPPISKALFEQMLERRHIVPGQAFGQGKGYSQAGAGEEKPANPADKGYGGQTDPRDERGPGKPLPDQRAVTAEVLADIRERTGGDEEAYRGELNILASEQGYNGPVMTVIEAETYLSQNADKTAQAG